MKLPTDHIREAEIADQQTGEPFFTTPRLIARRFAAGDIDDFVALRCDPEVAQFQDWESFSQAEGRAFVEGNAQGSPGQPGWFQFAIERVADGVFLGDCGLRILESDHRLAQIGYTIGRAYWGRGYATELVRALVDYAFAAFPVHRITASVDPRNIASIRVLEKAGLTKEAHFREACWFKGAWVDDAIFAVLAPPGPGAGEADAPSSQLLHTPLDEA